MEEDGRADERWREHADQQQVKGRVARDFGGCPVTRRVRRCFGVGAALRRPFDPPEQDDGRQCQADQQASADHPAQVSKDAHLRFRRGMGVQYFCLFTRYQLDQVKVQVFLILKVLVKAAFGDTRPLYEPGN